MRKPIHRLLSTFSFCLFTFYLCFAQDQGKIDSLENQLKTTIEDTTRINTLYALAIQFINSEPEQSLEYAQQALKLAQDIQWKKGIGNSYHAVGYFYYTQGDYPNTLATIFIEMESSSGQYLSVETMMMERLQTSMVLHRSFERTIHSSAR